MAIDVWGRPTLAVGGVFDGSAPVVVGGNRMLYEVAVRGMDADLCAEAQRQADSPQAVINRYAELHFERHGYEWTGYHVW